jgi:hypothetical protein
LLAYEGVSKTFHVLKWSLQKKLCPFGLIGPWKKLITEDNFVEIISKLKKLEL